MQKRSAYLDNSDQQRINNRRIGLIALWIISLLSLFIAPMFGLSFLNPFNVDDWGLIQDFRLFKVWGAWLIGAMLALSGLAFQALLRNPLAEPYTLGVASGSALGVALYIHLGFTFQLGIISGLSFSAFIGAGLITGLIFWVNYRSWNNRLRLILMGVILSFFCSSLIMLLQSIGEPHKTYQVMEWMMGKIGYISGQSLMQLSILFLLSTSVIALLTPYLNLLNSGITQAMTKGVNPIWVMSILFLLVSFMVGVIIAISGPIGFVGLIVPHIARQWFGGDHRILWLATVALGGLLLVVANTLASFLFRPAELPVGVITSLLGAPFFLWILFKSKKEQDF